MQETPDWFLGREDPLEKGWATHSSVLSWRIPWTVEFVGSQRVRHDWVTFTFSMIKTAIGFLCQIHLFHSLLCFFSVFQIFLPVSFRLKAKKPCSGPKMVYKAHKELTSHFLSLQPQFHRDSSHCPSLAIWITLCPHLLFRALVKFTLSVKPPSTIIYLHT